MKNHLQTLLAAAAAHTPRSMEFIEARTDKKPKLAIGQLWLSKPANPEEEPVQVLVVQATSISDQVTATIVVPMHTSTDMMDPESVALPREIMGFDAALAFGIETCASEGTLTECLGTLPPKRIEEILALREYICGRSGDQIVFSKGPYNIGTPIIDENDPAFGFHEDLVRRIEHLPAELMEKI